MITNSRLVEISLQLSTGGWGDLSTRFRLLREAYKIIGSNEYDPYPFYVSLTPIESHIWQDIRQWPSEVRMYPQYPVGRYFVDFGDPWKKVAIEADGKDFHTKEKDRIRDAEIEKLGWKIYHVEGSHAIKEGVISSILMDHYGGHRDGPAKNIKPIHEDYQPSFDNHKSLSEMGMPKGFIDQQISEFINQWYGESRPPEGETWDEMFMQSIIAEWQRRGQK